MSVCIKGSRHTSSQSLKDFKTSEPSRCSSIAVMSLSGLPQGSMLQLCRDQELSLNKALRRTSATGSVVAAAREGMACCSRLPPATRLIPRQHGTKSGKLSHVDALWLRAFTHFAPISATIVYYLLFYLGFTEN
jgi:hypothetical protein